MRRRAYLSFLGVGAAASFSALLLSRMAFGGSSAELGLGGIFFATLLSHMTVVARDMFVPALVAMSPLHNPLLLGAAAGLGGAVGNLTAYLLGRGVGEYVRGEEGAEGRRLARWLRRHGLWAVLIFSATPLPDTPILLLAGSSGLPLGGVIIAQGVGKTALYALGASIGSYAITGIAEALGSVAANLLIVAASIIFCILFTWGRSSDILFGWVERLAL